MTLGIDLETSPPIFINPDRNVGRNTTLSARQFKVGSFEQRGRAGINPVKDTITVTFKNRTKETIDTLTAFFQSKEGTTPLYITLPSSSGGEETIPVVCVDFTQSFVTAENGYTCTANLRKVNIPTFNGVVT